MNKNLLLRFYFTLSPLFRRTVSVFLVVLFAFGNAYGQNVKISGKVTDSAGNPMVGVTVVPVDKDKDLSAYGTTTCLDGSYSVSVARTPSLELNFSFLGMKEKSVVVGKRSVIDVTLEEDAIGVESVVVTGIYTRKAESFTGAVNTISASALQAVSNQNAFEALKNIDPSLMILDNLEAGSDPNAMASMRLRGTSSFPADGTALKSNFIDDPNMPLFILDGFETRAETIMDMDMNRIQSITILKDASAKAIYGSKAGNGVIVIETKSLNSGQTLVSYNGTVSLEVPDLSSYNLCNSLEKLEIERREGFYSDRSYTDDVVEGMTIYYRRLKKALEGEDTYWLAKPLRLSVSHKHSLSIELGSKDLRSITTFGYSDTQGAMKGSDRQTVQGSMNLSYRRGKWVFRNIMSVAYMDSNDSPYGTFDTYTKLNPYESPYTDDGQLRQYLNSSYDETKKIGNPLYDAQLNTKLTDSYINVINNFYAEFQAWDFLKLVARVGVDTKRTEAEEFYPAQHSKFLDLMNSNSDDDHLRAGSYDATNGTSTTFSGDVSAQINKSFDGGHDLFATLQYSLSQQKYREVTHYAEGFPNSSMDDITFARQYASEKTPTGYTGLNREIGALATAGYSYQDRYMVDATLRANGSSAFGTNRRWALFWSAGVAWNIHKERFLASAKWLEQLKLRFSAGSSGNQNYSSVNSLAVYKYYNDRFYNGFTGVTLNNLENPNIGWEQKMDYNLGLDFRTKDITLTVDAYISDTENMIFSRALIPSVGFTTFSDNMGKVRNKGIETTLSYRVLSGRNGFLILTGKIAVNDNRILRISDALREYNRMQQEQAVESGSTAPVIQYRDGLPVNSIWAVPSLGIDPATGKEIFVNTAGNLVDKWSASNLAFCGSSDNLYNGNFSISGEWKGFGINAVCTYYGGGYKYNTTLVNKVENVYIGDNVDRRIYSSRWYYKGQVAQYRNGYYDPTQATSRFVQRDNVLTISSVSLYYEFPQKLISKAKLSRLRLTLLANDLYTFSSIEIERGTSYPYARTFSFSVSATF